MTKEEILRILANDNSEDARYEVAKNPDTPSKVLTKLSRKKEDGEIRVNVALNPSTDVKTLTKLSNDENTTRYII